MIRMIEKRYKLIESDPCEDPYDCRMYVGILEDDVEELYDYKSICDRLNELSDEKEKVISQLVMLDNMDNWTYDSLKYTIREISKAVNYRGGLVND